MIRGPFMVVIISNISLDIFQRFFCLLPIQIFPVLYPLNNLKLSRRATKVKKLTGF